MKAKEFYDKRIKEDPTIGSVQLMEEYSEYLIKKHFCDTYAGTVLNGRFDVYVDKYGGEQIVMGYRDKSISR